MGQWIKRSREEMLEAKYLIESRQETIISMAKRMGITRDTLRQTFRRFDIKPNVTRGRPPLREGEVPVSRPNPWDTALSARMLSQPLKFIETPERSLAQGGLGQ